MKLDYKKKVKEVGIVYKTAKNVQVLWESNAEQLRAHGRWVFGLVPLKKRKGFR
jgi:hypothetical protein